MRFNLIPFAVPGTVALIISLLIVGCKQKNEEFGQSDAPPIAVLTQIVVKEKTKLPVSAKGIVLPVQQSEVTSLTTGVVREKFRKTGERVKKGDIVATLDARNLTLNWVENGLELIAERDKLEQLQTAASTGKATSAEVEAQEEKVSILTDIYYNSKAARNKNGLTAPLSGRIIAWQVAEGDTVRAGQSVGIIASYDPEAIAQIEITEPDYFELSEGMSASVTSSSNPNLSFAGKVISKGINDNPAGLPYIAKIKFENPAATVQLGSTVSVTVEGTEEVEAILIPQSAITERDGKSASVFLVAGKGRFAARRYVLLGPEIGSDIVIEKGLNIGDQVITQGVEKLEHGSPIMAIQ